MKKEVYVIRPTIDPYCSSELSVHVVSEAPTREQVWELIKGETGEDNPDPDEWIWDYDLEACELIEKLD